MRYAIAVLFGALFLAGCGGGGSGISPRVVARRMWRRINLRQGRRAMSELAPVDEEMVASLDDAAAQAARQRAWPRRTRRCVNGPPGPESHDGLSLRSMELVA